MAADAIRIVNWERHYEVNRDGGAWKTGQAKRVAALEFVRWRAYGLQHSEDFRELAGRAGPEGACRAMGLFGKLLEIAAQKTADKRGWILSGRDEAMGAVEIAAKLGFDAAQVAVDLAILHAVRWVEAAACRFAVRPGAVNLAGAVLGLTCEQAGEVCEQGGQGGQDGGASEFAAAAATTPTLSEQNQKQNIKVKINQNPEGAGDDGEVGSHVGGGEREEGGGNLEGLPVGPPGTLGSGGLESGRLKSEDSGDLVGGKLDPGNLTRRPDGQGAKGTVALASHHGAGGETERCLSWEMRLEGMDLERADPALMLEGLSVRDEWRREMVIDRALAWLEAMAPEYLAPPPTAAEAVRRDAAGCRTTCERKAKALYEQGGAEAVAWLVRIVQRKREEAKSSRGRLRNVMALAIAKVNERLMRTTAPPG